MSDHAQNVSIFWVICTPDKIVLNPKKNVDELLNIKMITFGLPEWKLCEFIAFLFEDKPI